MKRADVFAIILALLLGCAYATTAHTQEAVAPPEAGLTGEQLLQKVLDAYDDIDSHKYTWFAEGYDTYTKERQKQMKSNTSGLAKKAGVDHEIDEEGRIVRGKYEIEFMKPYLTQMLVVRSDFTPKIVWGTLITYRSDKNEDVWWAKPDISPFAIKRSVANDDAGGSITGNWTVAMLYMHFYKNNATLSVQPEKEFDDHPCYVLRYSFDWEKNPEWSDTKPPFDRYNVPGPVRDVIWKDMQNIIEKYSHIDYYIDKEGLFLRLQDEYIGGEFHWKNAFRNIEINKLDKSDF